jgi:hypothetical protein
LAVANDGPATQIFSRTTNIGAGDAAAQAWQFPNWRTGHAYLPTIGEIA